MLRFFRRQRPAPPQPVSTERLMAAYWGYKPHEWERLPEKVRADKRNNVTYAPNFKP